MDSHRVVMSGRPCERQGGDKDGRISAVAGGGAGHGHGAETLALG